MRKLLYIITGVLFIAFCWVIYDLISFNTARQEEALQLGNDTTHTLEENVNDILLEVMKEGEDVARTLESTSFTKESLEKFVQEKAQVLPQILGVTVAYEPNAFQEETRLYAPYYDKKQRSIILIEDFYDYTDASLETSSWYTNIIENGKGWVEPYYAKGAAAYVADFGVPFYYTEGAKKGEVRGMISMTISLQQFTDLIHSLSLGKTGYGFVTSPQGEFLAHPVTKYVGTKTVADLQAEETLPELREAYQEIIDGHTGNIDFYDVAKQQETLFFYEHVPAADWRIGVLFFKNDLLGGETILKKKYINIGLVVSLLLFFLLAVFFNRDYLSEKEIWYLGFFASFVLLCNILLVGYLQQTALHTQDDFSESPPVADINTLNSIINEQNQAATRAQFNPKNSYSHGYLY